MPEPLDQDQQIGYIISKIEELSTDQKEALSRLSALEGRVNDKFKAVEVYLNILKFVGLAIGAILTFQFGDVTRLWHHFFG